jgi:ketose-bisphosphate aldolase
MNMATLLNDAKKNNYAVPAINVSNMETINGVFEAAEKLKSPMIMQIAPIQLVKQKISYKYIVDLIKLSANNYDVVYAIHLDHGEELDDLDAAVNAGFTSVMYDGSMQSFEKNVENTKTARKIAAGAITLEGELGQLMGKEGDTEDEGESIYTNPSDALEYVERTGVDCLAVSIGNAHGHYKQEPKLNFDILDRINKAVNIPIVMHGASGLSEQDLITGIKHGITKINFFTAVDGAFTKGIVDTLEVDPNTYMMAYIENGRQLMMREVENIIRMCDSADRMLNI